MNKMKLAPPLPDGTILPALTPAGYKVLRLLQKGCAYQARGAWRFRGSHSPTNRRTLVGLLAKGLAECKVPSGMRVPSFQINSLAV